MLEFIPLPGISIGPFMINMHGIMAAIGMAVAYLIFKKLAKDKIPEKLIENIVLISIISGVIGARLLYVLANLSNYTANPIDVIKIWEGGISYLGGLMLAIAVLYIYLKKKNINFLKTTDLLVIPLVIGHTTSRIGDLLTWDHPGTFSNLPWAVLVNNNLQHPVIAYEMLGLLIVLGILFIASKRGFFERKMVFVYLGFYGLLRMTNDVFRVEPTYFGFRLGQIIGLLMLIISVLAFAAMLKRKTDQSDKNIIKGAKQNG